MAILGTAEGTRESQQTLKEIATELRKQNQSAALDRLGPQCPHCGSKLPGRFPKCASCAEDISWVEGTPVVPGQEEVTRQRLRRAALKRKKVRKAEESVRLLKDEERQVEFVNTLREYEKSDDFTIRKGPFVFLVSVTGVAAIMTAVTSVLTSGMGMPFGFMWLLCAGFGGFYFVPVYLAALYERGSHGLEEAEKNLKSSQRFRRRKEGLTRKKQGLNVNQLFQKGAEAIGMDAKVGAAWQGASLKKQQLLLNGKPVEGTWTEIVREVYTRIYVQVLRRPADSRELTTSKTSKTLIERVNEFLNTTGTPGRSKTAAESLIKLGELAQSGKIKKAAAQYHQQVWKTPIE